MQPSGMGGKEKRIAVVAISRYLTNFQNLRILTVKIALEVRPVCL